MERRPQAGLCRTLPQRLRVRPAARRRPRRCREAGGPRGRMGRGVGAVPRRVRRLSEGGGAPRHARAARAPDAVRRSGRTCRLPTRQRGGRGRAALPARRPRRLGACVGTRGAVRAGDDARRPARLGVVAHGARAAGAGARAPRRAGDAVGAGARRPDGRAHGRGVLRCRLARRRGGARRAGSGAGQGGRGGGVGGARGDLRAVAGGGGAALPGTGEGAGRPERGHAGAVRRRRGRHVHGLRRRPALRRGTAAGSAAGRAGQGLARRRLDEHSVGHGIGQALGFAGSARRRRKHGGRGFPALAWLPTAEPLTAHHFRKLLEAEGVQVPGRDETGDPPGRAWVECGDLDHYGHEHGVAAGARHRRLSSTGRRADRRAERRRLDAVSHRHRPRLAAGAGRAAEGRAGEAPGARPDGGAARC